MNELIRSNVPPIVVERDGAFFIEITNGKVTMQAPLGDGAYFFTELVRRLVEPALKRRKNCTEGLMPSKSKAQEKLMRAAAHNPAFARKVGVPQKVAKEFAAADKTKGKRK